MNRAYLVRGEHSVGEANFPMTIGGHVVVTVAGSQGNFELNVYKPVIAHNVLHSIRPIADAMRSFDSHCASGIEPDRERIGELMQ